MQGIQGPTILGIQGPMQDIQGLITLSMRGTCTLQGLLKASHSLAIVVHKGVVSTRAINNLGSDRAGGFLMVVMSKEQCEIE